jgi:hypothetical protein
VIDETLRQRLTGMAERDFATRERLAADGTLFNGYHPEMRAVHEENAAALGELLDPHGWPHAALAGEDGAEAAWLIAQHAISLPTFQRRCLTALQAAPVPAWQAAYLEDRIRSFEGRPQLYGTQHDWDDDGMMSPKRIEDPEGVDERRASVGLPPLAEQTARIRREASAEHRPDLARYRAEAEAFARTCGWR